MSQLHYKFKSLYNYQQKFEQSNTHQEMYYSHPNHYSLPTKEDPKLAKLRQDNLQLQKALQQLNSCYQQKISLLQEELKTSKQKEESLLEWKSTYIDKELFNNSKYQKELQRLVTMMEEMAQNYEKDNQQFRKQLEEKDQQIAHLKDQNQYLRQQKQTQELKIQGLAQKYIVEIQRLNTELRELKEQVNYEEQQAEEESDQHMEGVSKLTIQAEREETLEQGQYLKEDHSKQQSIYDQTFSEADQLASSHTSTNPLKDISNKNPTPLLVAQKSTYLNGSITSQSNLIP